MEKESLQGFLRENRIPPNRRGFYGKYIMDLEDKIIDGTKEIKDKD